MEFKNYLDKSYVWKIKYQKLFSIASETGTELYYFKGFQKDREVNRIVLPVSNFLGWISTEKDVQAPDDDDRRAAVELWFPQTSSGQQGEFQKSWNMLNFTKL